MWFRESLESLPRQDESRLSRLVQHSSKPSCHKDQQHSPANRPRSLVAPPDHVFATIWRSPDLGNSPLSPEAINGQDDIDHRPGLITDPHFEDWHIVILRTNVCSAASAGNLPSTLCERFASPICDGRAWYLRCGQSELPDMAAWLVWQRHEHTTILRQPPWSLLGDDDVNSELTDQELAMCKHSLFKLFESRSVEQIQLALLAIYFVTNSFRKLSSPELTAAVQSTTSSRSICESQLENPAACWFTDNQLVELCSPFLRSDADGRVGFRDPSMKKFMSSVQLPGLEHGHGMMTQICFEQIRRLGTMFIVRPWALFRKWFKSCRRWPLMRYVAKYWFCHYQQAAASRTDLSAELFRMINTALSNHSPDQAPILLQQKIINTGYSVSQIYDLPELAAIFRNMGASGIETLREEPSPDQWRHMIPMFGIRVPVQICFDREATVSEVFDAQSILCLQGDTAAAVTSQLLTLHLQPRADYEEPPADETDVLPTLLEYEHLRIHDWEEIDILELEQQTNSNFEDWEFLRQEHTSEFI